MPNHFNQDKTDELPVMKKSPISLENNTDNNRDNFLEKIRETPQYKKVFDPKTGKLEIWFVMSNDNGCKITLWNTEGSCTIRIKYFSSDTLLRHELHKFNPFGFSESVNKHLLTQEDLEKQRVFRQQEQEREDALKKAHYSFRNCVPDTCTFCIDNRLYESCQPRDLGTYT